MSNSQTNTRTLVQVSVLVAIIAVMSFTPLGYLRAGAIEISLLTIPVVIGAILCGPKVGALLGGIFGLTSFIQCFGMSAFGAVLLGINPVLTAIVCLVPRILMGWICGLIFKGMQKIDHQNIWSYLVASLSGAILNTVFFMTFLLVLFGRTEYIQSMQGELNVFAFILAFVGINGLVEAISCGIAGTAITKGIAVALKRR